MDKVSESDVSTNYAHWGAFPGWSGAPAFLSALIERYSPHILLEVGAGANPTLGKKIAGRGIRYLLTDVDPIELGKATSSYEARVLNLEASTLPADLVGTCDLVFSRMVNEHIRNGRRYHANIRSLLRPGGIAAHCFATLYTLPSVLNLLLPEAVSDSLLDRFAPRDRHQNGKFRAHYSWCRGPTQRMVRRFQELGYEIVHYDGYFGHGYYRRIGPLHRGVQATGRMLAGHPIPQICSYATIVLRRQE